MTMRAAAVRRVSTQLHRRLALSPGGATSQLCSAEYAGRYNERSAAWAQHQTRSRCYLSPAQWTGSTVTGSSTSSNNGISLQQQRKFQSEADFHELADETLETIQDSVEELFEDSLSSDDEMPEVNVASGVLTLSMPPHGTWVLNKQTPNRQIWWSSPLSGPRRYEYDEEGEVWLYTRYVDARDGDGELKEEEFEDSKTLGLALSSEIKKLYGLHIVLVL